MEKKVKKLRFNSSYLLRLLSMTIMLALISPVITNAQAGKVNFTGTWALNAEKSILGDAPGGSQRMGGGNYSSVYLRYT